MTAEQYNRLERGEIIAVAIAKRVRQTGSVTTPVRFAIARGKTIDWPGGPQAYVTLWNPRERRFAQRGRWLPVANMERLPRVFGTLPITRAHAITFS
jgi:hypothetical protein